MSITPNGDLHEQNFHEQNPSLDQHSKSEQPQPVGADRKVRTMGILLGILFAVALGEAGYTWYLSSQMKKSEQTMVAKLDQQVAKLDQQQDMIDQLNKQLGERFGIIVDELALTRGEIGNTKGEITRTRQYAAQLERKQKEAAASLTTELGKIQQEQVAAQGAIGTVNTEVTGVKKEVTLTKEELATTKTQLQRVVGDLGVQSDLIARNHDELNELRARGDRDYFEFDLRKADKTARIGGLGLQLKKTDVKRQKFTVALIADDRNIEKKDKTVFEPVQFYQAGARTATEIVVNQIYKDRIVGYVSAPKKRETKVSGTQQSSPAVPVAEAQKGS